MELVTATCSSLSRHLFYRRPSPSQQEHLFPEPFPYNIFLFPKFFFLKEKACRFSVRPSNILTIQIFMDPRNHRKPAYTSLFMHSRGSRHYDTPRISTLNNDDGRCPIVPRCLRTDRRKLDGNGILTVLPFADFFLRVRLGPTMGE